MEVAVMGSRAKLRTKEGGKLKSNYSAGMERSGMTAEAAGLFRNETPICEKRHKDLL